MAQSTMKTFAAAVAVLATTACGGSEQNQTPQMQPSNLTTTTGAPETTGQSTTTTPPGATPGGYGVSEGNMQTDTARGTSTANVPPDTTGSPMATPGTTPVTAPVATGTGTPMNDAQIAAIVETANQGEIDQAKEVLKKSKNARVRQFAQHMVTDHDAAGRDAKTLDSKQGITPQDSGTSATIKSNGDQVMSTLKSATGDDLDRRYIEAQVQEHQDLLDQLDAKLVPQATNAELKSFLEKVRAKVASHLSMAKEIESSLTK